jgi:hypothetical protein
LKLFLATTSVKVSSNILSGFNAARESQFPAVAKKKRRGTYGSPSFLSTF